MSRTSALGLSGQSSPSWGPGVNPHCLSIRPARLAVLARTITH